MATRSIDILIKARDFTGGVLGKFERGFAGFRRTVFSLQGALGGLAVGATLREAVRSFAEEEAAASRLGEALKLAGDFSRDALDKQRDFAAQLQRTTTIADDQVLAIQALGASIGKLSGNQLQQATIAAIGLSRALKIDVESAMKIVAKAAQGNTSTLARYGIILGDNLTAQEKFNEVLRIGAENFKMATAEVQTASGQYQQFLNAIGDTSEIVGGRLANMFTGAKSGQESFLQGLTRVVGELNEAASVADKVRDRLSKLPAGRGERVEAPPPEPPGKIGRIAGMFGDNLLDIVEQTGFPSFAKAVRVGVDERINDLFGIGITERQFTTEQELRGAESAREGLEARKARADRERIRSSRFSEKVVPEDRVVIERERIQNAASQLAGFIKSAIPTFNPVRDSISELIEKTAMTMRAIGDENRRKAGTLGVNQALRSALEARADTGDEEARLELERLDVEKSHNEQVSRLIEIRKRSILTDQQRVAIDEQIAALNRSANLAAKDRVRRRLENVFDFEADIEARVDLEDDKPKQKESRPQLAALESRFLTRAPGSDEDQAVKQAAAVADKNSKEEQKRLDDIREGLIQLARKITSPAIASIAN